MDKEIYEKIIAKKEFSELPKKDVELAFENFQNDTYSEIEKVKLTRDLLRKVFSGFTSQKLLNIRDRKPGWILQKHLSTRERLEYYDRLYSRFLGEFDEGVSVIDLGAGVNGFSYDYFSKGTNYIGVEAIGQLVKLMNHYFKKNKLKAKAVHESLFELGKIKKLIKGVKGRSSAYPKKLNSGARVVFLFKTIDSLEMLERDYSKKLISEITPLVDKVVVSFATRSMVRRKKFHVKRNWILDFLEYNYNMLDDFELGGERYIVFSKR